MVSTNPWIWLGAFLTIGFYSLMWKDSPVYRWAQESFIAFAIGHSVVMAVGALQSSAKPIISGQNYLLIIPFVLGCLQFFIVWRKYAWLAAYPLSIIVGVQMCLGVGPWIKADIISLTIATVRDAGKIFTSGTGLGAFTGIVLVVTTVSILSYFIFTVELGPIHKASLTLGRYLMMVTFGAYVATIFIAQTAFAVNRVIYILKLWLGL